MIDANHIRTASQRSDALHPPLILRRFVGRPVVQRVAPQLAVRRKIVRRHSGDVTGAEVFVQGKKLRMRPDIGGVFGRVDGQVSDQADPQIVDVGFERVQLAEEQILKKIVEAGFVGELPCSVFQSLALPQPNRLRPVLPRPAAVPLLERHIQAVIRKPVRLLRGKSLNGPAHGCSASSVCR